MRLVAFILFVFVAYHALLGLTGAAPGLGRDNYECNLITSERYRYVPKTPAVMLIGSSKLNFLDYDVLGKDTLHLGYGARGSLTSLEILNRSQKLPKLLVVEVGDTLQWPADEHCIQVATEKFRLGDILFSLQHRFQPCAMILAVNSRFTPRGVPSAESRRYLISLQHKNLSKLPREQQCRDVLKHCDRAIAIMNSLKQQGVNIILFDPPVEADVANSQFVSGVNKLVKERFASEEFPYLTSPGEEWQTRDGTHLMPESGKLYSLWLRKEIDKLLGDKSHSVKDDGNR